MIKWYCAVKVYNNGFMSMEIWKLPYYIPVIFRYYTYYITFNFTM